MYKLKKCFSLILGVKGNSYSHFIYKRLLHTYSVVIISKRKKIIFHSCCSEARFFTCLFPKILEPTILFFVSPSL